MPLTDPVSQFIDSLAERIAARLAERLQAQAGGGTPRYATKRNNPIGSARGFVAAAKSGAFPTFPRGREVSALWSDVQAWVESEARRRQGPAPAPVQAPANDASDQEAEDEAALLAAGVRLGRGAR